MNQTIVEAVLAHGAEIPDKLCVAFKNVKLNYREVCRRMKRAAAILQKEFGVQAGDRVMLSAMSKPDYVVLLLGIQYLGAISIPIDKAAKLENIKELLDFIQPKLLISDAALPDASTFKISLRELFERSGESLEETDYEENFHYVRPESDQIAEMLFTTGTTGMPKGGMLSYGNVLASACNTWHGVGMVPEDIVLIPLPLNHSVGMRVLRAALYIGASVVLQNGFTFAQALEDNIKNFGCTALVSVPASIELVYRQMQEKFADILGGLRYIEFGAGSLSYDMKRKLIRLLPNTTIYNTWGSTETGGAIFLNVTERQDKLTSLGKPAEGIELKVVDSAGKTIQAKNIDTAGRMALRGKMQMQGYYNLPKETAETLVDGWLFTNDMVYTDDEGFVYMLGRADDIINVGGEKVSPIEVENIAQEYEGIRECACIGVPDPDDILGQVPVLYIVPEGSSIDQEQLVKFLAGRMEKYKLPHRFLEIAQLPRNRMQKLDRRELHSLWEDAGDENLMNEVIQNIFDRHSVRDFLDKQIPGAYLEMIVKAGIYAPNGHNLQTWKFTVITGKDNIEELKRLITATAKENKVDFYGFQNPAAVILVSNDRRNKNSIQDASCAAENIMLAAGSYGIGSTWINALSKLSDIPEVREYLTKLHIPDTHIVWATVIMGYPSKDVVSPKRKMDVVEWIK